MALQWAEHMSVSLYLSSSTLYTITLAGRRREIEGDIVVIMSLLEGFFSTAVEEICINPIKGPLVSQTVSHRDSSQMALQDHYKISTRSISLARKGNWINLATECLYSRPPWFQQTLLCCQVHKTGQSKWGNWGSLVMTALPMCKSAFSACHSWLVWVLRTWNLMKFFP